MNTKPTRQSNIELLRIISMIMVLCVHFTGATFNLPYQMTLTDITNVSSISKTLMECFSIIGVNCFVLISGYFGIKPSIKSILNFILTCVIYSVSIYTIYYFIKPEIYDYTDIINSFAIFSHTDLWFIPAYFGLYLISPILNNGVNGISKRKFTYLLIALTFINVYLGWFWQGKINPTGYNIMQMIYIYIIGRFLNLHVKRNQKSIYIYLIGYFTAYIFLFMSTFICDNKMAYAYNSPFVICTSIFFFLIFTTFKFKNQYINFIASSAFSVYLIHKMPPIWLDLREFLITTTTNADYISFSLFWICFILIIFMGCITIDKIRIRIITPIIESLSRLIKHYI